MSNMIIQLREYETGEFGLSQAMEQIKELRKQKAVCDKHIEQLVQAGNQLQEEANQLEEENLILRELSGPRLVRCYGTLYSQARVDALDSLDTLPQLHDAVELKSKILFSVVVLAFRSAQALLNNKREQVCRLLLSATPPGLAHAELESAIATFLHRTVDTFDLSHSIEEVTSHHISNII
ncbi:uncharacterized protein LOC142334491 isoform X1 [Lycorma delicatula]|uniref:uncharacterized protein LOC142334491 isoform X1 n=1 Tax=Lycorma delicatula TaxID=130591 RepID=UPI003F5129E6